MKDLFEYMSDTEIKYGDEPEFVSVIFNCDKMKVKNNEESKCRRVTLIFPLKVILN